MERMTITTDSDLYLRGAATLLASWEQYACGSDGAAIVHLDGASAGVFPNDPERAVYNNALVDRDLGPSERAEVIGALHDAYASAGVERYAVWVHERDEGTRKELRRRSYTLEEYTRAMGMSLDDVAPPPHSELELDRGDWSDYVRYLQVVGAPEGLLGGADPTAFHLLMARLAGEDVATALAFDHDGDCGVFNVSTLAAARRQGLGTALTARALPDAAERGCSTASLQATPMAERIYAALGFRDLGRILEYVPPPCIS